MKKLLSFASIIGLYLFWTQSSMAAGFCDIPWTSLCSKLKTIVQEIWNQYSSHVNEIHFIWWGNEGNNFWWFFVMTSNPQLARAVSINVDWKPALSCQNRLEGYYFSAARWNLLLPITNSQLQWLKSLSNKYDWVSIQWGLFSNCNDQYLRDKKHNSIVWHIKYFKDWQEIFSIIAWRQYDLKSNKMIIDSSIGLMWNFQLKDDKIPIGFFFDSNFWIAFLGWKIAQWIESVVSPSDPNYATMPESLKKSGLEILITNLNNYPSKIDILDEIKEFTNDKITFKDSTDGAYNCNPASACPPNWRIDRWHPVIATTKTFLSNLQSIISADWIIAISKSNSWSNILDWIIQSKKLIYTSWTQNDIVVTKSDILNISDIVNRSKENAERLCRGKWTKNVPSVISASSFSSDPTLCIDDSNIWTIFTISQDLTTLWTQLDIIIRWNPTTKLVINSNQSNDWYLNVFLDKWIMLLNNNISVIDISSQWTTNPASNETQFQWTMIRWNYIINWLFGWTNDWVNITWYNHRLFLEGSFWSLNTIWKPLQTRIEQVESLFWAWYEPFISLTKIVDVDWSTNTNWAYPWIFLWRCFEDGSSSTDWTACVKNSWSNDQIQYQLPNNAWYIRANGNMKSFLNSN